MRAPSSRSCWQLGWSGSSAMREFQLLGRRVITNGIPDRVSGWLDNFWNYPQHRLPAHPYSITISRIADAPDFTETWIRRKVPLTDRTIEVMNRGTQWV